MSSFEIYKVAVMQYNKAMNYHTAISYNGRLAGKKKKDKNSKERKKQQEEYDKAMFYYNLYKATVKLEESEMNKEC